MIKKTINNDLDLIAGTNNSIFTGVDDQVNLYLDPIVTGYAFIYWVQLPEWFEKDDDLKHFKQMTQINFRSFQGITPIELNTVQTQMGFAAHEANWAGGITRGNTEFTLSHKEFSGSPMRKMYQKWISFIKDPRTNVPIYPKLFNVDYGARNHSGQLLYLTTRADVTNTQKHIVEFAAFYPNVIPTSVPLDTLYNFEIGTQDSPTIEIPFKSSGVELGPNVEKFAEKILREKIMNTSGDSYLPFIDSYNSNTEATEFVNWGSENPLEEIYLNTEQDE